ncbi:MAG TPA: patatin-like phospholipase family protein [Clostridiales bacterium]|jgi:NTE family protein|nr:patatin-like phospholipase family protein [Clostridiales bacterium]
MSGKTALVLGGGGARGAYEIGVWQALRETGIEPSLVVGASVGAINAAVIAQGSFELATDLWVNLNIGMVFDANPLKSDDLPLRKLLDEHIDEAAIRNSPVEFGLVTVELPSFTPHYLFIEDIPEGKLIDFILASASLFPAILPQEIDKTRYADGGYYDGIPVKMALDRKADNIVAVDLGSGIAKRNQIKNFDNIIYIRSSWDLGSIISFGGQNAARIMRLGYLDTLKRYGFFDGDWFTFALKSFSKRDLLRAEAAGRIFGLSAETIYSRSVYEATLIERVEKYRKELSEDLAQLQAAIQKKKRLPGPSLISLLGKANEKSLTIWLTDLIKTRRLPAIKFMPLLREPLMAARYLVKLRSLG